MTYRHTVLSAIAAVVLGGGILFSAPQAGHAQAAEPLPETVRETHGDWAIRCSTSKPDNCYMVQLGFNEAGNPVAEFSLVRFGDSSKVTAGATVIAPLGTALPEGMVFRVDEGQPRHYVFDFCTPAGCAANLALPQEEVSELKRGGRAYITIVPVANPDRPITVSVSLSGFTKAYDALK